MKSNENRREHRHTLALDTEVLLHEDNVANMFRCRTANIGVHGAYLPVPHIPLGKDAHLEIVLRADSSCEQTQFRVSARIAWKSDGGMGLVFESIAGEDAKAFRKFLFAAKVADHARARKQLRARTKAQESASASPTAH